MKSKLKNLVIKKSQQLLGYFTYGTDDQREDWGKIEHPKKMVMLIVPVLCG